MIFKFNFQNISISITQNGPKLQMYETHNREMKLVEMELRLHMFQAIWGKLNSLTQRFYLCDCIENVPKSQINNKLFLGEKGN